MTIPVVPMVHIQKTDFDVATEIVRLTQGKTDVGAIVTFTGLCRDEAGSLTALELEHYPGMTKAEITRIAEEAIKRWPLSGISVIHRFGKIKPGENIVLVVTASKHRKAAFDASNFLMDYLKLRAPFWKKEHHVDGSEGGWVDAKESDEAAVACWAKP